MSWGDRHLLGLRGVEAGAIRGLLDSANRADEMPGDALAGRTIANLFFENSTRTRLSFAIAATRLGASVVDLGAGSSMSKGESLLDTARTVEAMGVDALVVRTREDGVAARIAAAVGCSVLNGGDGRSEHPTQALTDALTIARNFGRTKGFDLAGLRVAIVGDVIHSRVAGSNIACLTTLGAGVTLVGPEHMAPGSLACEGVAVERDLDAVIGEADVVMMLRIQFERHGGAVVGSHADYRAAYGLTAEREGRMKPGAIVMHPGPMNRGLEIDGEVADGPRSVVLEQVAGGVGVRMAALLACVGGATLPT